MADRCQCVCRVLERRSCLRTETERAAMSDESAPSQPPATQAETTQAETTQEIMTPQRKTAEAEALLSIQDEAAMSAEELSAMAAAALASLHVPDDWKPLPRDPNCTNTSTRHFLYRGTVLFNSHLLYDSPGHWARFQGRPSDVFVVSFPKSGTTWLQEIVWRVVHHETGPDSGDGATLEYRFPLLDTPSAVAMRMTSIHEMESPRLMKTHLMHHLLPESVHTSGAKVLYITRDPRDVCVSYYHYQRMVHYESYRGTFAEFRDKFMRGEVMYGPYREHVKGYLDHSDTVLCVTYEQLHEDRAAMVRRVAEFLGKPVTANEAEDIARYTDFESMKKNPGCNFRHWEKNHFIQTDQEGTFMRKGKVGDWRNYFTEEESEEFMKWRNEPI